MMDFSQVGTCVAIVVICYLAGIGAKLIPVIKDNYIPVVVGIVGGILGVVGMYIVSGLASTGVNQIYKQVKKDA